jgi:hypothetical protein
MSTRSVLALSIALAVLGWIGLTSFTYNNPPDGWNRWIALSLLAPTLLTTFIPLTYAAHLAFGRSDGVLLRAARQSVLAALFLTLCAWLRMVRALNWANTALMLVLFVLTDVMLAARESR